MTKKFDLTGQELLTLAAGWSDADKKRMDMIALHSCARVMADRTISHELRAQVFETHEIVLGYVWNRLCRKHPDVENHFIPEVE
jgi:hypothetical protein